jgi:hypothetical protein
MGALAAPIAMPAQDRDHDRDRDDRNRVYDASHRDYHNWNQDEDRNYRQWYGENYNNKKYRDYRKLHRKDQDAYWNWRHTHDRDHDNDRH